MTTAIHGIERILAEKKDLIRLFLIAAILGFSINGVAGLFLSESGLPPRLIFIICTLLLFISLGLLAKDLLSTLAFEDTAEAVVLFDPRTNDVLRIEDYRFAESQHKTLRAVRAESKAICAEWEKSPLIAAREAPIEIEQNKHNSGEVVGLVRL